MWKYGGEKHITGLVGNIKEKDHLEDLSIDQMTTAQWFLKKQDWRMTDWFKLAQNRDKWLALLNTVINPGSHKIQGVSTLG